MSHCTLSVMCVWGGGEEAVKVVPRQVVKGLQIQTLFCGLRVGRQGKGW